MSYFSPKSAYSEEIRKFETTDPAHADLFNSVVQALVNNDAFVKSLAENLAGRLEEHTADEKNPHNVTKDQVGLSAVNNTSDMEKPVSTAVRKELDTISNDLSLHKENKKNPHNVTKDQVGLSDVDNTSDLNKPISTATQERFDEYYQQLKSYTDKAINELINGAPTTLDTLKELADAINNNKSVIDALNLAIGTKANAAEFDSHTKTAASGTVSGHVKVDTTLSSTSTNPVQNAVVKKALDDKIGTTGNASDTTVTFTPASERKNIASGEKLSVILGKLSRFFTDLKTVAFSGSYNDLSSKPTIPTAVRVKGSAESSYRTGDVNITPTNLGLGNVNNTADSNKSVKYAASAGSATTATSATKATQDANGNTITSTYATKSELNSNLGLIQGGKVTANAVVNDYFRSATVKFAKAYSKAPIVVATLITNYSYAGTPTISVRDVTTSGFVLIWEYPGGKTNANIVRDAFWIAIPA